MSGAEKNITILRGWARDVLIATGFMTRLPMSRLLKQDLEQPIRKLADVAWAFPAVGIIIGGLAATALMIAHWAGVPPLASALIGLAVGVAASGALHEDGLADVADGFGGGVQKQDKLRIMRDSAIGTYGMLALVFSVGIRAAALSGMAGGAGAGTAAMALVAAACISRAFIVGAMTGLSAARDDGLGSGAGKPEIGIFLTALAVAAVAAFVLCGAAAWILLPAGGLATIAMMALAKRQIGGQTGDVLGATQQVSEVAILVAAAVVLG